MNSQDDRTNLCVIGLWTQISVWICRLPTLEIRHKESLTSGELKDNFLGKFKQYLKLSTKHLVLLCSD